MNRKEIKAALKRQQKEEGFTPETAMLLKLVDVAEWQTEWEMIVRTKFIGLWPNTHARFYPSDFLLKLQQFFEPEDLL